MSDSKVDWSKVKRPASLTIKRFYNTEPENPKNAPGFYHWEHIQKLQMAYDEDGDGHLVVTLIPDAKPAEAASGMMWMWLRVSARGTAVKHPDATNQEHSEYIDDFNHYRGEVAKKAMRKERQTITDPLRIRELLMCDITNGEVPSYEDFRRIPCHQVNPLTAKFVNVVCCNKGH